MNNLIVYIIILLTVITTARAFKDQALFDKLKFNAAYIREHKAWYRFFSYGFVHADWFHLGVNMWVLYIFAPVVLANFQVLFGNYANLLFLLLYISAIGISTIASFIKHRNNYYYNAIGASGAVSAVLYASILFFPTNGIGLLFIPIYIPAWIFGLLYLGYSVYMNKRSMDNVGHDAHFWGAVYGFIFPLILHPKLLTYFIQTLQNSYF